MKISWVNRPGLRKDSWISVGKFVVAPKNKVVWLFIKNTENYLLPIITDETWSNKDFNWLNMRGFLLFPTNKK